jgi:DNA-binding beta-propeller fold protein YncE
VYQVWGKRYDGEGQAPPEQFKEPWDVVVGEDGSVFVADTWNHRVQKFTADGQFISSWGSGILSDPANLLGFFGPRGIAINDQGEVFISDTGNKRIVYFDPDGNPLGQFGEGGINPGQLDEPVGLAFDADGNLLVADTWNQRIQVFSHDASGVYAYASEWDIDGWDEITATNYPYLAVDTNGNVFVTDPDNGRVIEFTSKGEVLRYWEDGGANAGSFNLPVGIAVDADGGVWVVDSGNSRLLHFSLP